MTAWTVVPGYPREIGGALLWFGSRAKFVRGVREEKGGKTTTISGLAAFVQRFEQAMIDAHKRGAEEALAALEATLDDLSSISARRSGVERRPQISAASRVTSKMRPSKALLTRASHSSKAPAWVASRRRTLSMP
jgi:hypothetical protein